MRLTLSQIITQILLFAFKKAPKKVVDALEIAARSYANEKVEEQRQLFIEEVERQLQSHTYTVWKHKERSSDRITIYYNHVKYPKL